MTPERADSIGNGTRIRLARFWPTGTGSLVEPGWNCQMPFRLSQFERTNCGRGYSARTLVGLTCCAQSVINGACLGAHEAGGGATVTRRSRDLLERLVTSCATIPVGIVPSEKSGLPPREFQVRSGNWPMEKLKPAMLMATGPLTARDRTTRGALDVPPVSARSKPK